MDFEVLISITAIIFGCLTAIAIVAMVTGLIRFWIKERNQGSRVIQEEAFLIALKEFKEKTDRRLTALETGRPRDAAPSTDDANPAQASP